jgi:glycosyltransferase involved in cell wall biosynthesis
MTVPHSDPLADILCLSTTDWDEIWGSRQQIMTRLAGLGHRVLFVERQVGIEHLYRDPNLRARKQSAWRKPRLRQLQENLWLWQPPMVLPGRYYNLTLNAIGQRRLAKQIRNVAYHLGFIHPILWLYPPHSAPLIGQFDEQVAVYHCIERFIGNQSGRKRRVMETQETELLRRADLVFTHAEGLRRLYAPLTRRPIVLLPSAADVAHFQSTGTVHPDLHAIPRPRLGVAGTLDGRINIKLLCEIAHSRPGWQILLIGHVRPGRVNITPLLKFPNVHILGPHPFADLPALLNGMDLLLIPYVHDELTDFISPIKLYEYLAVGKPVISVDLPEVHPLAQWISIAESPSEWMSAIEQALQTDTPAQVAERRRIAWQHTWDVRVGVIQSYLPSVKST